jgi:hypothetical protein
VTLEQLAGWDLSELNAGVGRLDQVADRLPPWRIRLDALGRQLGTAECWSGPAGTVAGAAVVELSTVASGVSTSLGSSLTSLQGLTAAAAEAQEWAAGAVAGADAAGLSLDAGRPVGVPPPPSRAMAADQVAGVVAVRQAGQLAALRAERALDAAARALHCARDAQQPLAGLGVTGAAPVGFFDLAARLPQPVPSPVPVAAGPEMVAAWWAGLTAAEQLAAIDRWPGAVGALDGLPGWARDQANRTDLAVALQQLPPGSTGHEMAWSVQVALSQVEDTGRTAQLLQFDPEADLVAVSVGDLDTATAVGVLVPGIETTPGGDLFALVVAATATAAAPAAAVAVVAWLGYRTPRLTSMWSSQLAQQGGPALDRALDGMAAARSAPGAVAPGPRTTVIAHSYGTLVTSRAVQAPGRLAADAVVLLGSPGTEATTAGELEVAEVYGAWSPADPVSVLGWYGRGPMSPGFGDAPLPTEPTQGHTDYYDRDRPTLAAMGQVVAGVREHG